MGAVLGEGKILLGYAVTSQTQVTEVSKPGISAQKIELDSSHLSLRDQDREDLACYADCGE